MSQLKRFNDPAVIGPGVWWSGHMLCEGAVVSQDWKDYEIAYAYIQKIRQKFTCLSCRHHIEAYCVTDPLERFAPLANILPNFQGLALWFHGLHSNADKFADKANEDYDNVKEFFRTDEATCSMGCGSSEPQSPAAGVPKKIRPKLQRTETRGISRF